MNNEPVAYENTDKEIWREIPDDYYAPSIFVTAQNTIGINVGGSVYVKHVHEWHRLANPAELTDEVKDALMDALSGWKYIRQCHGDLYGVGWDRVQDKLEAILRKAQKK